VDPGVRPATKEEEVAATMPSPVEQLTSPNVEVPERRSARPKRPRISFKGRVSQRPIQSTEVDEIVADGPGLTDVAILKAVQGGMVR
jgi:hypothetical protein